jgi:hypothetical protein
LVEYNDFNGVWSHRTKDGHGLGIQNTSNSYFGENEFRYNWTGPCLWTGGPGLRSDNNIFARNFVHHNQKAGIIFGGEGQDNTAGNIFCFNIISDNGTAAGWNGGFRINRSQSGRNEFSNNTLARNDINFYLYSLTDYAVIQKNISYAPRSYHVLIGGALNHNVFEDNLYYPDSAGLFGMASAQKLNFATWRTKTLQDAGSLVGDPLFSNASLSSPEHFRPAENSPALRVSKKTRLPLAPKWIKKIGGPALSPEIKTKGPTDYLGIDYLGKPVGSIFLMGAIRGPGS